MIVLTLSNYTLERINCKITCQDQQLQLLSETLVPFSVNYLLEDLLNFLEIVECYILIGRLYPCCYKLLDFNLRKLLN